MILGNSQKKRSKNRFVSLLLSGVLLGVGVGVPAQIIGSSSASAAGYPAQLVITRASVPGASGAAFTTQPEFEVRDASGNAVTGTAFVIAVYWREGGAPQPANVGTSTVTTGLDGKATFPSSFGISGNLNTTITIYYRISSVVLYATETITLTTPGAASQLIVTQPSTGPATGSVFATQPQVTVKDAWNNNVGGIRTITATRTASTGANGTLVGTNTATADAVTGIATFPADFGISGVAGTVQTVTYSSEGLTSATQKVTIGNPTAPEAPQLSGSGIIGGASVVLWATAPANGGSAITGYEYQAVGLSSWSPISNLSDNNGFLFFTVDTSNFLRRSDNTYFQLRAINVVGTGTSNTTTQLGLGGIGLGSALGSQPSSSGLIMSGETLTNRITFSGSPISYTYKWVRCAPSPCTEIPGATSSTYLLTDEDVGYYMQNRVTATYSIGSLPEVNSTTISQVVLASTGPDTTSPTITSINSSTTNGTYKAGDVISIQVNFSESVAVTGTPRLTLETGSTDRAVNYASGTGSNQLTFTYTVQAGDTSADLDYLSTSALDLNGGTIKDATGNNATLTLPAPAATNSLGANKAIAIDGTAPTQTISSIDISADTGSSASDFTTSTASQTITATLSAGLGAGETLWGSVNGGSTYTDISASVSGTSVSWASTTLVGSSSIKFQVRDVAGNAGTTATQAYILDTTAPTLTLAASAATSGSATITFTVTGNEAINCSTLSTEDGTDFTFTGISAITGIAQTSSTVCTITATSTATLGGAAVTSTLTSAASFSATDTAGNAQTTIGGSPASITVTVTDSTPPTLSVTSASSIASTTATLNFTSDEAGTYYYVIYAAGATAPDAATVAAQGAAIQSTASALAAANTASATGLSPATAYTAYVIVKDSATNASTVSAISFTTLATVPGTPGTPTAVAGNAQATVTVSAPTSGGTPTSYTVTASPGGATCTVTGASGSCTVTGLTNGTAYTFTSTATNNGGTSASASAASNSVTPAAPVCDAECLAARAIARAEAAAAARAEAAAVAAAAKAVADAAAKVIADAAAKVAAEKAAVEAKIVSDAAAKVAAEKVVVDKTAAEAAAKAAVESAIAATLAKATADAAAAAAAAQAKAAADAQQAAIDAAAQAQAALESATTTAAAKAAATATAAKAATTAATSVKAAAAAAKAAATAKVTATNAAKQVDIAIGALGSKTASAANAAQANVIAAAAKTAANNAAKAATAQATAAKAAASIASKEAATAAEVIVTTQKAATEAATIAKTAADADLKATEAKIAAATDVKTATEAVVAALNEKVALAEESVKATSVSDRAVIDKKIADVSAKVTELQAVIATAAQRVEAATAAQVSTKAAATEAAQAAAVKAAEVLAAKTESLAKTAAATKAAADASLAAKVATAAVAAAAKVPSKAVIATKPSTSTNKNSAKATVTGLKKGQKIKVTVNVKDK